MMIATARALAYLCTVACLLVPTASHVQARSSDVGKGDTQSHGTTISRTLLAVQDVPQACARDFDCEPASYCNLGGAAGGCQKCWKCCLFPETYGACPQWCSCGQSAEQATSCYQVTDCGPGSACLQDDPDQVPTCQACDACYLTSPTVIGGSCNQYCPYSEEYRQIWNSKLDLGQVLKGDDATAANSTLPGWVYRTDLKLFSLQHMMYLAFSAADMFAEGPMNSSVLAKWMSLQGVLTSPDRTRYTFGLYDVNRDKAIQPWEWIIVSLVYDPKVLVCPGADQIQSMNITVVFPGCPCIPAVKPAYGICPPGYRCSTVANTLQQTVFDPILQREANTGAICTPCVPGQYCPAGTYVEDENDLSSLACQRGQYCPSPSEQLPCPAGYFCTSSTVQPVTCDINTIISTNTFAVYSQEDYFVTRVYQGKEALKGNYCPVNSTSPSRLCPKGTHCPDPSNSIKCPTGHYCPMQSVQPKKCGWLESCSVEGVANPLYSSGVFACTILVIIGSMLLWAAISWHQNHLEPAWLQIEDELEDDERQLGMWQRTSIKLLRLRTRLGQRLIDNHKKDADAYLTPLRRWLDNKKAAREGRRNTRENRQDQAPYKAFQNLAEITIRFAFKEVRCGGRKKVLQGVMGQFEAATLNAILGPSGCGKTTMLKALFGQIRTKTEQYEGRWNVWYNDTPLTSIAKVDLPKIIGFVPQDDILHEDLTVRENLFYASSLKLDPKVDSHTKHKLIEEALAMLSLLKKKDSVIGSVEKKVISGGERKRVNIALELVGTPSLLFLDEPTSGLDATNSMTVMWGLEALTRLGMNVVTVIHQPRSIVFHLFDQVLLLGESGSTVYQGPPMLASPYFSLLHFVNKQSENPADFYLDIISGRAEMEDDCRFVIERHHMGLIWANVGANWMREMLRNNHDLTSQRPMLKEVTPEVVESLKRYFDRVVIRHNASDDDMMTSKELAALFRSELQIACEDTDVHALIQVMNRDSDKGLSRKELQNALCRPPIEVVKLDTFLASLRMTQLDDDLLAELVHSHKDDDDNAQEKEAEGLVERLTSQILGSMPSLTTAKARSATSASHLGKDDMERSKSEFALFVANRHSSEAAAHSAHVSAPASSMATSRAASATGILLQHPVAAVLSGMALENAAADLVDFSAQSMPNLKHSRFRPAVTTESQGDLGSATPTGEGSVTMLAASSPFSSHMQQSCVSSSYPSQSSLRNDAALTRANSDQSTPKAHLSQHLPPHGSAVTSAGHSVANLEIDGVELSQRSRSVRFKQAGHPAAKLLEKGGLAEVRPCPDSPRIKHFHPAQQLAVLPDSRAGSQVHPQLKAVLSSRRTPSLPYQFWKLFWRTVTKQCRSWPYPMIDICLLVGAAYIIGFIHGTSWRPGRFPNNTVMAMTALGVLSTTIHIRTLDQHYALFMREVSSGMSITAYYLAATVVDMFWVLVSPAVFLSVYYHLILPQTSFSMFYAAALGVCWWSSGVAYTLCALLPQKQTLVGTVFVALVMGAFINGIDPSLRQTRSSPIMSVVEGLSYTRWSMEILAIAEFRHYLGNMKNTIMTTMSFLGLCKMEVPEINTSKGLSVQDAIALARMQQNFDQRYDKCNSYQAIAYLALFGEGLVLRVAALVLLHWPAPKLLKKAIKAAKWPFTWMCRHNSAELWWEADGLVVEGAGTSFYTDAASRR